MDQLPSLTDADTQPSEQLALFEEPTLDEADAVSSPRTDDSTDAGKTTCHFCGGPVDPKSDTTYAETRSWVSGPKKDSAVLRQYTGLYADSNCISLLRSGHHPLQKTLEETISSSPISVRITAPLPTDRSPEWNAGFHAGLAGATFLDIHGQDFQDGYLEGQSHRDFGSGRDW